MNTPPRFLVLLDDAPRALLFDDHRRLLGEVIEDDGFIVDSLLRSASERAPAPGRCDAQRPRAAAFAG